MLTQTQLKIVSYLVNNPEKLIGIRELAKQISIVYYLVQRNIHLLKEKGIITITVAGKTSIISLNQTADIKYLIEAETYKTELFYYKYPKIRIILKEIIESATTPFFILLVFGSYTKQPRKDSDLDLLIITPNQEEAEKIEKVIASIARTTTIEIHHTIATEKSFKAMLQKKELNVGREAKNSHILIYGFDSYYRFIQ